MWNEKSSTKTNKQKKQCKYLHRKLNTQHKPESFQIIIWLFFQSNFNRAGYGLSPILIYDHSVSVQMQILLQKQGG